MSDLTQDTDIETDIALLNYLTTPQLEARFVFLTDMPPPQPITRTLLITAVAYETIRKPQRDRLMTGNGH